MKREAYLGLDVGGSGAKAGVIDQGGRLLGISQRSYQPQLTADGHVEIPIETIYAAAREAAASAIHESDARILALAISSQGQTFVSLDDQDKPLHPAIVWYDARAADQAQSLDQTLRATRLSGALPYVNSIASGPKIMWLRDHFPEVMSKARRHLLLPDYFAYRLTRRAVIDPSTASSTALYAEDAADYCPAALEASGIRKCEVAEIRQTGHPVARVVAENAAEWGLDPDTLVVVGTNDQYAGALGAGNCRPGIVSLTSGTALALVTLCEHLPQPLPPGLLGGRFPITRYQFALAFSKTAGVVLEWFQRELSPSETLRDLDEMASHVPVGSRGVVVLPHFDGMISPVLDQQARGGVLNLALHHTRSDMYRAALESLGYNIFENLELLRRSGFSIQTVRSIGGGAKSNFWSQMVADITGLPIERPVITEAAVVGAAMIAAVGAGAFSSLEESSQAFYREERVFMPDMEKHSVYQALCQDYVKLYRHVYHHQVEHSKPGVR